MTPIVILLGAHVPNGGPDCCGTCWYNNANIVSGRRSTHPDQGHHFCTIRQFAIEVPFWTYCFNHRDWSPVGEPIPVGPVYRFGHGPDGEDGRYPVDELPDSEQVRMNLLRILQDFSDGSMKESAIPMKVVLDHLEALGERRAIPILEALLDREWDLMPGVGFSDIEQVLTVLR